MKITNGRGCERTFDCAGNDASFDICLKSTMRGHSMTLVSFYKHSVTAALDYAVLNEISIVAVRGEGRNNCKRALSLMAQGVIDTKPILTHTFSLDEFPKAYDYFVNRKNGAMKVVVVP
jgi:L-iditol 2-dehydrogenase